MDSLTSPISVARELRPHREPVNKRAAAARRPAERLACVLLLVALAAAAFAPPALADRWAGGCAALIHITPAAETLYGDDIRTSLGIISFATGIAFQETDGPADLTYDVGDTSGIGSLVLGYYDYDTRSVIFSPTIEPQYPGQDTRQQANVHLRLVLHETLHWLGLEHAESPTEVMFATITDESPRLGITDLAGLRDVSLANGCIPQPS